MIVRNKPLNDEQVPPVFGTDTDYPNYCPGVSGRSFVMYGGIMTTTRTITLSSAGAFPGDTFEAFSSETGAANLVVVGADTATLRYVPNSPYYVKYVFGGQSVGWKKVNQVSVLVRRRTAVIPDVGNRNVSIADGDLLIARAVGAACDWTIQDTGAVFGDEIEIYNATSTFAITVKDSAGSTIAILKSGGGSDRSARFVFDLDGFGKWAKLSESNQ